MQGYICAVPRTDHKLHFEGVSLPHWQAMPHKRAGKIQEYARDLAWWGLTFFPPDGASCLLGQGANISEASYLLILLLASQALPYDEVLNWLQFA